MGASKGTALASGSGDVEWEDISSSLLGGSSSTGSSMATGVLSVPLSESVRSVPLRLAASEA